MAKKYTFNAQLHYVWDCGEGHAVNRVLKQLGLEQEISFERYDPDGFDHMRMPGYALDIPSDGASLGDRLSQPYSHPSSSEPSIHPRSLNSANRPEAVVSPGAALRVAAVIEPSGCHGSRSLAEAVDVV